MAPGHIPDPEQTRTAVTARYSGLARAARAGQQITDCDPGPFAAGCFGAPGTPTPANCPRVRCGPASGAATPSRSPSYAREKPCWISVLAAGSTCCCPPAASPPAERPTAWTAPRT